MSDAILTFRQKLFSPVSGLSLAAFRFCFGFLVLWDVVLDLFYGEDDIQYKFILTEFHFKHALFSWVEAWPTLWLAYAHYFLLLIASFCVMVGLYYRIAIVLTTFLVAWIFFIDMSYYLNHYYLVIVTGFLMMFLPMNRVLSIDVLRHPEWKDETVPFWSVAAVRTKVEVVLIYAGLVKLNPDWLRLEPLGTWLRNASDWHFFGNLAYHDWFIAMGAYGAIALHLLGAPLLLFRRTRLATFFVYCCFHLMNSYTFDIGIFPFLTIFATLIFFDPDWPKQFLAWGIAKKDAIKQYYASRPPRPDTREKYQKFAIGGVIVFLIVQMVLPLRPLFYPGPVAWTQEGHQFSWRMKLRSLKNQTATFRVYSPSLDKEWFVEPRKYLTYKQERELGNHPEYIIQFAHHLKALWAKKEGVDDVEVYADVFNSLNGRKAQRYVDPTVDLAKEEWGLAPETWILPLTEPLVHWKERGTSENIRNQGLD